MHPELFHIGHFTVHAYGFFIAIGAYSAYRYLAWQAQIELGIESEKISRLLLIIIAAAFVGGKLLFYLEDPAYYFGTPKNMFTDIGNGFVFYGSLLFAVPSIIYFFRINKWPIWQMLDMVAITACIVHAIGRIGCLMAGCCHGTPTDLWWGVAYTNPLCMAEPLNVALHPTQLYEFLSIGTIALFLYWFKKRKQFQGQVFLIYLVLYGVARSIIEVFRGDEERGYVIDGILSHSQFIALVMIIAVMAIYFVRKKKSISH